MLQMQKRTEYKFIRLTNKQPLSLPLQLIIILVPMKRDTPLYHDLTNEAISSSRVLIILY